MRASIVLALATFTAACAGGAGTAAAPAPVPAPAPAVQMPAPAATPAPAAAAKDIDPSGNFNVSLAYGGQSLNIYLQMWKKDDGSGYTGSISADGIPTIALNSVAVSGKQVTAALSAPDGTEVSMEFTIDGADLAGSWKGNNGDGSQMTGKRAP